MESVNEKRSKIRENTALGPLQTRRDRPTKSLALKFTKQSHLSSFKAFGYEILQIILSHCSKQSAFVTPRGDHGVLALELRDVLRDMENKSVIPSSGSMPGFTW